MSNDRNWRTETNALDYLGHQKKQLQVADRRPVIRKPSDLVGPGIAANSVRVTDFNDLLATFDGFYSSAIGAASAPNSTDPFVGFVSSDDELGGVQQFSSLTDGSIWTRPFSRSPLDPSALYWGPWQNMSSVEDRVVFLEDLTSALSDRVTALENQGPLYTGTMLYYMTNMPPGGTASGTASFGITLPFVPVCWAIKAGFVSGSSMAMVTMVDQVTANGCRVTVTNMGSTDATFADLPIRWFAKRGY